jgi:hypothetical protein
MLGEATLRRRDFREGARVRMADGQDWRFPAPPERGLDAQYDALAESLDGAEDRDDWLRIELAISILLLARNYDLKPGDYTSIFDFGNDRFGLERLRSAIGNLIGSRDGDRHRLARVEPETIEGAAYCGWLGRLTSLVASWAVRMKGELWS